MFEQASKMKLRFETERGYITTEDLWDIPLIGNGLSLDNIAKFLNKKVKESEEESFVIKKSDVNDIVELKFNIVKHIISSKLADIEVNEKRLESKAKKEALMEAIENREKDDLNNNSIEELRKMLEDLQ